MKSRLLLNVFKISEFILRLFENKVVILKEKKKKLLFKEYMYYISI